MTWDGDADTPNTVLGESYGINWEYVAGSSAIVVNGRRIEVGEPLPSRPSG